MELSQQEVTHLLIAWGNGDPDALEKLTPLVYQELRRIARRYVRRERQGRTLQTSDLVNEAYIRLIDYTKMRWQDRAHFFAVAAQAMRRILVEHARERQTSKRGSGAIKVSLDQAATLADEKAAEVVALDEALRSLAAFDARKSQVVELRYFGGLSIEETAEALGVAIITVKRDWTTAKIWLRREINRQE
jgi:RNA polymerase sigma factor (TIGR02999 family)